MSYEFAIRDRNEAVSLDKILSGAVSAMGNKILTVRSVTEYRVNGSSPEEAAYWLKKASEYVPSVLIYNKELGGYQGSEYTSKFIDRGGFKKLYIRQLRNEYLNIIPKWVPIIVSIAALFISVFYKGNNNSGDRDSPVKNIGDTSRPGKVAPMVSKSINDSNNKTHRNKF